MISLQQILPAEFPKPFSITRWICLSSCFFMVPCIYAYLNSLYLYSIASMLASIFSVNHWRSADYGFKRTIDIIVARVASIIYVVSWGIYSEGIYFYGYGIPMLLIVISSYLYSDYLSIRWHQHWVWVHMFFHLSVCVASCLTIYCIIQTNSRLELDNCN